MASAKPVLSRSAIERITGGKGFKKPPGRAIPALVVRAASDAQDAIGVLTAHVSHVQTAAASGEIDPFDMGVTLRDAGYQLGTIRERLKALVQALVAENAIALPSALRDVGRPT